MAKSTTDIDRRRRRRRRRIQIIVIYMAIALGLAWFFESQATTTVVFVRHAEKALTPADDPGLNEAGQRRAAELARQLADVDVVAGIDAVYATPYRRSVETAKPVADALKLQVRSYDAADTGKFLDELVRKEKGKIVLVVGHSDTVPAMIGNMGASKRVPAIAADEYDNIYIVTIPWFGKTKTLRLRYGQPYEP
jgi:broad specificity phosphatase PhoE